MVALKDELLAFSLIASFRSLGVVYNIPISGERFDPVTSFGVLKHLMFPYLRRLIAMDETCVKVNGLEYWVYAALDVDRNEILSMGVYPSRSALATEHFIREVLKYCDGKPKFIVDNTP